MRRLALAFLALSFFLVTSACKQAPVATAIEPSPVSPLVQKIKETGKLRIGTSADMPPLTMMSKDGQFMGIDSDLGRMIAGGFGAEPVFVKIPFEKLLSELKKGNVDMVISGMTITPERNANFTFIGPYFKSGKSFLTKKKNIAEADDMRGINSPATVITALKGSTSEQFARKHLDMAILLTSETMDEAVLDVINDDAEALVADYPICVTSVFRYPDAGLISLISPITYEPLGIAINPGDELMTNWLTNFINTLRESGELKMLAAKWLEHGEWLPKLP